MKIVIIGAGAVGGVAGALLSAHHDVTLVARGAHLAAIQAHGLTVYRPGDIRTVRVRAVDKAVCGDDAIILLAVKTQDAAAALRSIDAPASTPIVCLTNGLDAERQALRWFERVYAMCVYTPSAHLEPGSVEAWGTPHAGMFDIGCYPGGSDALCEALCVAFEGAGMSSRVFADIMRWKRGKLLFNLSNALDALCGPSARNHPIVDELRAEAVRVYEAAGLTTTTDAEAKARRGDFVAGVIEGKTRTGGSTWQSLARGAATLECEYLNGEIALIGRQHGVPTPKNDAILRAVTRAAERGIAPGSSPLSVLDV